MEADQSLTIEDVGMRKDLYLKFSINQIEKAVNRNWPNVKREQ